MQHAPRQHGRSAPAAPPGRAPDVRTPPHPAARLPTPGGILAPGDVLRLQATVGNQAVQRILAAQPPPPRGMVQRTDPLETMVTYKPKGKKTFGQRPADYGPVKIDFEDVPHVKYKTIVRPIRVAGLVYPSGTGERPGAPEPVSGVRVSEAKSGMPKVGAHGENARNQGIADAQKGHIMALELGGPDIPQNIVPQWAQWQSNGEWREMEKEVLAIAQKVEKTGNHLHYSAELHYKEYGGGWIRYAPKKSVGTPTGFTVTITEVDGDTGKPVASKVTGVAFAKEQRQNRTDDMMFMRTLQELAAKEGEELEYADWNPHAKKEKGKKGKPDRWKGGWHDDESLNPFAEREAKMRKKREASEAFWAEYQEGWRDGYEYVEEDLDSDAYLRGYAEGRETYVDDYDRGFMDGYLGTPQKGETDGYYQGVPDGIEHRQNGGKKPGPSGAMEEEEDPSYDPNANNEMEDEDETAV